MSSVERFRCAWIVTSTVLKEMNPEYFGARKSGLVLLALLVLIGLGSALITPALAHPPSAMALEYDAARQTLLVAITHTVDDPSDHYVTRLEFTRNGSPYLMKDYDSQPTKSEFTHTIAVEAVNGDVLGVTAFYNRYGSIKAELTVSVPAGPATSVPLATATAPATPAPTAAPAASSTPEAPGFELLFALASAGTVCWLLRG